MPHWFADVAAFRRDPLAFLSARGASSDAPLIRMHLGPTPAYLVASPELVKPLLKMPESLVDKGVHVAKMKPVLGESSLTMSGGPDQARRRAALHTILAKGVVEQLVPQLAAEIRLAVARTTAAGHADAHELGAALALRLVCTAVFGKNVLSPAEEERLVVIIKTLEDDVADEMFRTWPLWPWEARRRAEARRVGRAELHGIVASVRRKAAETSAMRALDRAGLTDDELSDEVVTLLIAGHHTTGSNIAWVLHHLASDRDLLSAIREEAEAVTGTNGEINADGLKNAPLSLAFVRELLRLYPSSWWYARQTMQPQFMGGLDLKTGTWLIVSPWQLHRDARYWPEPEVLRLDRSFANKAFVPFGLGVRACTGIGLAMLELQLTALEFSAAVDVRSHAPANVRPRAAVTLVPPRMTLEFVPAPSPIRGSMAA